MKDQKFEEAFEEIFKRECELNEMAKYSRDKYYVFYLRLWNSRNYIKKLNEKMDEYEKKPFSQRRYIIEVSDNGSFERKANPYYIPKLENPKYCFACGCERQKRYMFCPECGTSFK